MIAIHVETVRRMRRQPGIVVRLFDQVFGAAPLVVKPDYEVDGTRQVGHEDAVSVPAGLEQLILVGFPVVLYFLARFLVAQGDESVFLLPPLGLIAEFTLPLGIGLLRWLPLGLTQLLDHAGRLARRDHELGVELFIGFDGLPAVESRIRAAENPLHARR